jgi:hypothetical protein
MIEDEIKSIRLIKKGDATTTVNKNPLTKNDFIKIEVDYDKHSQFVFLPRLKMTIDLYFPMANQTVTVVQQVWYELKTTNTNYMEDLTAPKVVSLYSEIAFAVYKLIKEAFDETKHENEAAKNKEMPPLNLGNVTSYVLSALTNRGLN